MKIDQHSFHGFLHSAELVEAELRRHLAPLGIHPRQARILDAMDRIGPVSQSDLVAEFGITPASMSTMTDRLLAAGYISRTADPISRRQNILKLTRKGRNRLDGIAAAWSAVDDTIAAALGEDAAAFLDQARRLRNAFGGIVPGSRKVRD